MRKGTIRGTEKKKYFSKYGMTSTQTGSNVNSRYFRTNLEELAEIALPTEQEIVSEPTEYEISTEQGFALSQSRDKTLNKATPEVKQYLQEIFDKGNRPNNSHKSPEEALQLLRTKFKNPKLWLKAEQIKRQFSRMTSGKKVASTTETATTTTRTQDAPRAGTSQAANATVDDPESDGDSDMEDPDVELYELVERQNFIEKATVHLNNEVEAETWLDSHPLVVSLLGHFKLKSKK